MDLKAAQDEFVSLLQRLNSSDSLKAFLGWVKENWFPANVNVEEGSEQAVIINGVEAEELLENIAVDLRQQLPFPEAQVPSENIVFPTAGPHAGSLQPATVLIVDRFLYDDRMVDILSDEGRLPKNYCLSCGSRSIKPLNIISHSASRENLAHVFLNLLPDLSGKHLLDVGSRLGSVLYGAFAYSQVSRITGIELNAELANLSSSMLVKYNMQSRVQVLTGDVRCFPEVISSADVVVMNNVLEFFAPLDVQRDVWLTLARLMKPGALLLTHPSLADSLAHLEPCWIQPDRWVECVTAMDNSDRMTDSDEDDPDPMDLVHLYRVLQPVG